jgi:hypothetical protein
MKLFKWLFSFPAAYSSIKSGFAWFICWVLIGSSVMYNIVIVLNWAVSLLTGDGQHTN